MPIVPLATKSAASFPIRSAAISSSRRTVGSSPKTSSPTSARYIASRIAGVGWVTVSLRRSMIRIAPPPDTKRAGWRRQPALSPEVGEPGNCGLALRAHRHNSALAAHFLNGAQRRNPVPPIRAPQGAEGRIWTADSLIFSQVLYQAELPRPARRTVDILSHSPQFGKWGRPPTPRLDISSTPGILMYTPASGKEVIPGKIRNRSSHPFVSQPFPET